MAPALVATPSAASPAQVADEAGAETSAQRVILDEAIRAIDDRLALAVPVAAAKRVSGAAVDDPAREAQAADAFVALVTPAGVPEAQARRFITAQFEASKHVQRALLSQWQARPTTAPVGEPPSLVAQVRPAIDAATAQLAKAYVQGWRSAEADPVAWRAAVTRRLEDPRGRWRWQREAQRIALMPLRQLG
jgi:chorismate mutase